MWWHWKREGSAGRGATCTSWEEDGTLVNGTIVYCIVLYCRVMSVGIDGGRCYDGRDGMVWYVVPSNGLEVDSIDTWDVS